MTREELERWVKSFEATLAEVRRLHTETRAERDELREKLNWVDGL